MAVFTSLVLSSIGIMVTAFVFGLFHETARETNQERYDHEFERIVTRSNS